MVNRADIQLLPYSVPKTGYRAIDRLSSRQAVCRHEPSKISHQHSSSLSCHLLQLEQAITIVPTTPSPITMGMLLMTGMGRKKMLTMAGCAMAIGKVMSRSSL